MVRGILVVVAIGLFAWGGLYWLELRTAGFDPPVPTTLTQVVADYPCGPASGSGRERDKSVRLDGVEIDANRTLKATDEVWSYAPVRGTDDKLFLEIRNDDFPPPGPMTVIGRQRHEPSGRLPPELVQQAEKNQLFVVSYRNRAHQEFQRAEAFPFLLGGGVALGLAAILQAGTILTGLRDRRKLAQAVADAQLPAGPCTICSATAQRFPVYVEMEKRRMIRRRLQHAAKAVVSADCCPACYARLGKLHGVWATGQVAVAPLTFLLVGSVPVLYFLRGWGILVLAIAVGLFAAFFAWMHGRYGWILGPVYPQLKAQLGTSFWNPLILKIGYSPRPKGLDQPLAAPERPANLPD